MNKTFHYLAALFSALIRLRSHTSGTMSVLVGSSSYDGTYRLYKVIESAAENVECTLPPGDFRVQIKRNENDHDLHIKIGNSLNGKMTIVPRISSSSDLRSGAHDAVSIRRISSTRMMPPEPLYRLERALLNILPEAQVIFWNDDGRLVWEGPKGSVSCTQDS
jgi:hypothetical protein